MVHIELEIHTSSREETEAIQAYWAQRGDGEWAQTVKDVCKEFRLKNHELNGLVKACATATLPAVTCQSCGAAAVVTSRTHLAETLRLGNVSCGSCRRADQAERERTERERVEQRRSILVEHFPIHSAEDIDVRHLSLFQAIALHALFSDPAVEAAGMTTPTDNWPKDRPWVPDGLRTEYERRLVHADPATILIHPDSSADAFVWEGDVLDGSFYLGRVSYYLLGFKDDPAARPGGLLDQLNHAFREGPWPRHWREQWKPLWEELSLSYASAYLDVKLGEHHLELKQGDGTRTALADALATFSLGQVFNFIYRAARDSAAYYQRGGINKRQAANSTVGRISGSADRARAAGWDVKHYSWPWNLPMSAFGEAFFSKVMWQPDMMQVACRDARPPSHAWPQDDEQSADEDA